MRVYFSNSAGKGESIFVLEALAETKNIFSGVNLYVFKIIVNNNN
jgi:hypothetical protein